MIIPFGDGWRFGPEAEGSSVPGFDDSGFEAVTLPHTVAPLSWQAWDPAAWERVWVYRKHFDAFEMAGRRVFVDFGAAMTHATVTLNGTEVGDYLGGYLPFSCEITGVLEPAGNVLAVRLDSGFNLNVPPDRPAPAVSTSVDFWQPGGIYRDVRLRVVPEVFLADVFAKPVNVLDSAARQVVVQATVDAAVVSDGSVEVEISLQDQEIVIATDRVPVTFAGPGQATVTVTLGGLDDIILWDLDEPKLYYVVATLLVDGRPRHEYRVRIGFREATFALDGFYLNGRRVKLFGVNRHQFFPFAGGAMPARIQARDAEIIRRELNCTMVRCSHYPQSEAFFDACDELGLLAWEEAPGWGYLGDAAWLALASRDIGQMIVRDRNHPSIVIWGARLNETPNNTAFYTSANELAHDLDDSRPTAGAMAGMRLTMDYQQDVFAENDYSSVTGQDGAKQPSLDPPMDGVRPALPGHRGGRHAVRTGPVLPPHRLPGRPAGAGHGARAGARHRGRRRPVLRAAGLVRNRLPVRRGRQRVPGCEIHRGGGPVPGGQAGRRHLPGAGRPAGQTSHRARVLLGLRTDLAGDQPVGRDDLRQPGAPRGVRGRGALRHGHAG